MKMKHTQHRGKSGGRRPMSLSKKENLFGWIFVLPFIIGFLAFMAYPLITSMRLSVSHLNKTTGISDMSFVGLQLFRRAFTEDIYFVPQLLATIRDTLLNTPFIMIFSLIIAILLNKKIRFRPFFRSVFFLPFVLGTGYVLNMLMEMGVTQQSASLVESVLNVEQLRDMVPVEAITLILNFMTRVVEVLWKTAVQILLFLSGLQGISSSLYESPCP